MYIVSTRDPIVKEIVMSDDTRIRDKLVDLRTRYDNAFMYLVRPLPFKHYLVLAVSVGALMRLEIAVGFSFNLPALAFGLGILFVLIPLLNILLDEEVKDFSAPDVSPTNALPAQKDKSAQDTLRDLLGTPLGRICVIVAGFVACDTLILPMARALLTVALIAGLLVLARPLMAWGYKEWMNSNEADRYRDTVFTLTIKRPTRSWRRRLRRKYASVMSNQSP
jgi:hypothetical protein